MKQETRIRMSIAAKQRTIPRKGLFKKGHVGYKYWLGKKHSKEHNSRISNSNKGKKQTDESNKKRSETLKQIGHKPPIMFGKSNKSWKGGITPINHSIRTCSKYYQWIFRIFSRDKFTCKMCSIKGVDMNAHHIKHFSVIMKENKIKSLKQAIKCNELWDINNGITLCIPCHKLIHKTNKTI